MRDKGRILELLRTIILLRILRYILKLVQANCKLVIPQIIHGVGILSFRRGMAEASGDLGYDRA